MASELGWAVVGTGSHVMDRMAPALSRAEGTRLAAVCSRDMARAEQVAGQFGFARAYDSYQALLKDDAVDAVYICTPNSLHAEQTIAAARAGKHVLVEKPMALTTAEAEAMVEACDAAGVKLGVGFHLRHHPAHREVWQLITEGSLGRILLYDARWIIASARRDGWWQDPSMVGAYIFMARGVHLVDFVSFLSGREPIAATMITDAQGTGSPLEETAVATVQLDDNSIATLVAARGAAGAENSFAVYGTSGNAQGVGTIGPLAKGSVVVTTGEPRSERRYDGLDPYQAEVEGFYRSVIEGTTPSASGLDGMRVVRVTEALLASARTGRTIRLS